MDTASEPVTTRRSAASASGLGDRNSAQCTGVRKHAAQKLPEVSPPGNDLGRKQISDKISILSVGLRTVVLYP